MRLVGKAFKARTRTGYYVFKFAMLAALLYWIVLAPLKVSDLRRLANLVSGTAAGSAAEPMNAE